MNESSEDLTFYAHGKFLITGEYLVLKGAKALAVPLKRGQSLLVKSREPNGLLWQAYAPDGTWFQIVFDAHLNILETDDKAKAETLQILLQWIVKHHPSSLAKLQHKKVVTQLDFHPNWGWGSSSTLIHNLAQWLEVNPYELLKGTFGGSGYDVACAAAENPIFYQLDEDQPIIENAAFHPSFQDHIWFVYTGQKQNSHQEVKRFLESDALNNSTLQRINEISEQFISIRNLHEMGSLMHEHEQLVGQAIGQVPIQQRLFNDFDGYIKSMGAWGGDFIMVVSEWDPTKIHSYFTTKGLSPVFSFKEIIVNK